MGVVNYSGCGQSNMGVVSNIGRLHVEKVIQLIFINSIIKIKLCMKQLVVNLHVHCN